MSTWGGRGGCGWVGEEGADFDCRRVEGWGGGVRGLLYTQQQDTHRAPVPPPPPHPTHPSSPSAPHSSTPPPPPCSQGLHLPHDAQRRGRHHPAQGGAGGPHAGGEGWGWWQFDQMASAPPGPGWWGWWRMSGRLCLCVGGGAVLWQGHPPGPARSQVLPPPPPPRPPCRCVRPSWPRTPWRWWWA